MPTHPVFRVWNCRLHPLVLHGLTCPALQPFRNSRLPPLVAKKCLPDLAKSLCAAAWHHWFCRPYLPNHGSSLRTSHLWFYQPLPAEPCKASFQPVKAPLAAFVSTEHHLPACYKCRYHAGWVFLLSPRATSRATSKQGGRRHQGISPFIIMMIMMMRTMTMTMIMIMIMMMMMMKMKR